MRHVFNTSEVAHQWAHGHDAKNSQGNHRSERGTLYSYAEPIGRLATNDQGETVAILATRKWSITTSSHQSSARSAVNHIKRLYVDTLAPYHSPVNQREKFADEITRKTEAISEAKNAKSRAKLYDSACAEVARANEYCAFFGLPLFDPLPGFEEAAAYALARRAEKLAARKKADAAALRKARARLKEWMAGEHHTVYGLSSEYLRLSADGSEVQTTQGASVPVEHVRRVAKLVLGLIRDGKTYQANGHTIHLGHYAIDEIDEHGTLHAGCHKIERKELERFAKVLESTPSPALELSGC